MKYILIAFILLCILFLTTDNTLAQIPENARKVEKTTCRTSLGHDDANELKRFLETEAKREAVAELFGEFLASYTETDKFVLSKDNIITTSAGTIRLAGSAIYTNHPTSFAEVCISIVAYITTDDIKKYEPVELNNELCFSDANLTTQELEKSAKDKAIIQAILNYDRRLETLDEEILLGLIKNKTFEGGFDSKTGAYCTNVTGTLLPIELQALLASNISSTPSESNSSSEVATNSVTSPTKNAPLVKLNVSTARATSRWGSGYSGLQAIDGNINSYWATKSGDTVGVSIEMIFSKPTTISRIGLFIPNSSAGKSIQTATLTFSDKSSQQVKFRGLGNEWEYVDITPVTTDLVLLTIDQVFDNSDQNYASVYEIQFFGPKVVSVPTKEDNTATTTKLNASTARAESFWSDAYTAVNIIDNQIATYWATKAGDIVGSSLEVIFSKSQTINRIGIFVPNVTAGKSIKRMTLSTTNGSSQEISFRGLGDEWEYVDIQPINTDYILVTIDEVYNNSDTDYLSVYELQFWGASVVGDSSLNNAEKYTKLEIANIQSLSVWGNGYSASNATDGNNNTYWASKPGDTVGISFDIGLPETRNISAISIFNPIPSAGKIVKEATLIFSDGSSQQITFRGLRNEWEIIEITPVNADNVTLVINDVYNINNINYLTLYELQLLAKQ